MLLNVMQKIQTVFLNQEASKNLGWMNTLSEMSELGALSETRAHLAKINFSEPNKARSHIELVLEIDTKTYRNLKKITHNYLISMRIDRDVESDTANAVFMYQRQLYSAYTQFLDFYHGQTKIKFSLEKLNLILARLLNAAFMMNKWRYFDDQPAPVGTWDCVHKVIKTAENLAVMNTNLFLYDFQSKETSIASILKRGFMMDTLQKGNFSRLQIQLTDQILKIWSTNPVFVNKYKQERHHFFIALESDRGPERIRAIEKFAEYRFWKTTRLADLIEAYLCAVDTQKSLEEFGLEKIAPPSVMIKLFKKLRSEWCVEGYTRQRRKEARIKNGKLLNVSHGLHDICHRLESLQAKQTQKTAEFDGFKFDLKQRVHRTNIVTSQKPLNTIGNENWWLVDESISGFAVDLGTEVSNWVESGILVGFTSPDDKEVFSVAEIKSVRKQADGSYRVGLETMSKNAVSMQVSRVQLGSRSQALSGYYVEDMDVNLTLLSTFSGLLMNNEISEGDEESMVSSTLVMPRREFKRGSKYRININGDDRVLSVGRIVAKHRDWVRVELLL